MTPDYDGRCRRALNAAGKSGCGALLVTSPVNVRYLSGFSGEDSWLLIAHGSRTLITDSRFAEEAGRSCRDWRLHLRKGSIAEEAGDIIKALDTPAAAEARHLPLAVFEKIAARLSRRRDLVPTEGIVENLRLVKDAAEAAAVAESARAAVRAFRRAMAETARDASENELAAALEYYMRLEGAEAAAFPTIVAREPNSSLPHARPSSDRLCDAPTFLVDWGARLAGYNSDLTRLVARGKVTPRISGVWKVLKRARKAALALIKPRVKTAAVDAAARGVIADAGYGEFFGHGLGHGVGLEVHEGPVLSPRSTGRLRAGMVVSVEPGIYLPGEGGARLEDMVLVTARGARILTHLSRDPVRLARDFG